MICGVSSYVCGRFSTTFLSYFGVGHPAYLSNHNPFSREKFIDMFIVYCKIKP